jgi:hypothetical protein
MKGCEAYLALCSNTTAVEQCACPGPIPGGLTTFGTKDALDALCYTHCMDGCMECYCAGAGHTFAACPDPLTVLASMCTAMPTMHECAASGFAAMCGDADVAATFPAVCDSPVLPPTAPCPEDYYDMCKPEKGGDGGPHADGV